MRQKLRLLRADGYSFNLSTLFAVEMLTAFLDGKSHIRWLGNEQGAIPAWDDIVLENYDRSLRHIQVKRQQNDFDSHTAKRGFIKPKKPNQGVSPSLVPLSPLDESMAALALWFSPTQSRGGPARRFLFIVPSLQVLVKKEFALKHFEELCAHCNNPQTTAMGLQQRASAEERTAHIFDWLTSWCGFSDWDHILQALRNLQIQECGLEQQLQSRALQELDRWFEKNNEVLDSIRIYLEDKATDLGGTTPRLLLNLLRSRLRHDAYLWTQYSAVSISTGWHIAGTVSDVIAVIDAPDKTVPIYWQKDSARKRNLHIAITYPNGGIRTSPLIGNLIRLAVHLKAPGHVSFNGCDVWSQVTSDALANTLGIGPEDLDLGNLHWIEKSQPLLPCDSRPLATNSDVQMETERLSLEMTKKVYLEIATKVTDAISLMPTGDLQAAIEIEWVKLSAHLDSNEGYCQKFLISMLNPASEGLGPIAIIRLGPRTANLLVDGILMFLAVKVALDREATIHKITDDDIKTICLHYWGGPVHGNRRARQLIDDDSDDDVEDFIGKENARVILMPGVSASPSELSRARLADDIALADNFASPKRPILMLSRTRGFRRTIESGSIAILCDFLRPSLESKQKIRSENIIQASK